MPENLNPKYKEMILRALEYHFPQAKVYLFGSRARGDNKEGADVDMAVDIGSEVSIQELARARNTLNNLPFALTVDLVDMHAIPDTLKKVILTEGILWKNS